VVAGRRCGAARQCIGLNVGDATRPKRAARQADAGDM
jgi:hypothetical protein